MTIFLGNVPSAKVELLQALQVLSDGVAEDGLCQVAVTCRSLRNQMHSFTRQSLAFTKI